jgi:protein-tyrosine phosphatase
MAKPVKLLFVCMGNICRSPAGENVMRHWIKKAGKANDITCDSAGTIGHHVGEAPDSRMSASAAKRGYTFTGRSRKFIAEDFHRFDLILAMDQANFDDICAMAKDAEKINKVRLFCDFVQAFDDSEVPDPYYGGAAGFEHVMDLMEDGCQCLLQQIEADAFSIP